MYIWFSPQSWTANLGSPVCYPAVTMQCVTLGRLLSISGPPCLPQDKTREDSVFLLWCLDQQPPTQLGESQNADSCSELLSLTPNFIPGKDTTDAQQISRPTLGRVVVWEPTFSRSSPLDSNAHFSLITAHLQALSGCFK